ncbi:MAG: hypothetical protein AAFZ15_23315 [Bacteroidota bacterium]
MKTAFFISLLCVLALSIYPLNSHSQSCEPLPIDPLVDDPCQLNSPDCPKVADPELDELCWGYKDITPYLARTVDMKRMWASLAPNENEYDPDCEISPTNCIYCQEIEMLVEMQATMITRVNQFWGVEVGRMKAQSNYWKYLEMLVRDINEAFDCAGLRRPIIQAGLWETMHPSVCQVAIPACVIDFFKDNYPNDFSQEDLDYYQPGISFDYNNICFGESWSSDCPGECETGSWDPPSGTDCRGCTPDVTKLETRMWYYYLATNFIDRGFKGIWLGIQDKIAKDDGGLVRLTELLNDIRDYAAQEEDRFVVIQGEGGNAINNQQEMLFDYSSYALWPREIFVDGTGNPINVGSLNDQNTDWPSCSGSNGNYDADMYHSTPCAPALEPYMTFIDKCHNIEDVTEPVSGETPLGCNTSQVPFTMYLDSGPGCYNNFEEDDWRPNGTIGEYYLLLEDADVPGEDRVACQTPGNPQSCEVDPFTSSLSPWGWDDASWFVHGFMGGIGDNGDQCRSVWIERSMETIRGFGTNENSFLTISGRIDGSCCQLGAEPGCTDYVPPFILASEEHEGLKDDIIDLWSVEPITVDDIGLRVKCVYDANSGCGPTMICGETVTHKRRSEYTFFLKNPDYTSIYTWHIYNNDINTWLPYTYGRERTITVDVDSELRVYLRQDNLRLPNNIFGVEQVSSVFNLTRDCCVSSFTNESANFHDIISKPADCRRIITVDGASVNEVDEFYWNLSGGVIIQYLTSNRSSVLIHVKNSASINYNYCAVDFDNMTIYNGNGYIPITEDCMGDIEIAPNPTNKSTHQLVDVIISNTDLVADLQRSGELLTFHILRNYDGAVIHSFDTDQTITQVNVSNFENGVYSVFTYYNSNILSTNFIVVSD